MALGALVNENRNTEPLRRSLAIERKKKHPIHQKVKNLNNAELNKLLANLSLPIPRARPRKLKAISDHFFREYPDAPLTNLERIMDEDTYFEELTRVEGDTAGFYGSFIDILI